MKSQMRYNTKKQIFLTQFLIYLIDEGQATYESFSELMPNILNSEFTMFIVDFKKMLSDLRLNYSLVKEERINPDNIAQFGVITYYLNSLGIDNHFEYEHLDEESLIKYSMTIVYLMLRNKQYITTTYLSSIFPYFNKKIMFNLLTKLKEIIPGEINKNQYFSYIIDLD